MGLSSGRLRQQVTVRQPVRTRNADGGYETTWADLVTVWAEVIGLNGRETTIGQALQGISTYRVTIRYRDDISAGLQLRYGAIDLNIRSVADPDGRREQLQILADTGSVQ